MTNENLFRQYNKYTVVYICQLRLLTTSKTKTFNILKVTLGRIEAHILNIKEYYFLSRSAAMKQKNSNGILILSILTYNPYLFKIFNFLFQCATWNQITWNICIPVVSREPTSICSRISTWDIFFRDTGCAVEI